MNNLFLDIVSPLFSKDSFDIKQNKAIEDACKTAIDLNLFMLVYSQLAGMKSIELLNKYRNSYFQIVGRSIKQEVVEKQIIDLLKRHKIPSLIFKGNALARDVYKKPNTRSSSDIDILVKLKDIFATDKILKQEGYEPQEAESLDFWITRKHHAVYQCAKTNIVIEVHWNFCIPGFFNLNSEDIWENVDIDDNGNAKLNPEMTLVQLFIHNSMHAFKEFRIFVDLLWAMHRYNDSIDWIDFTKTLKKTGLLKTAYISINQINKIWGNRTDKIDSIGILFNEIKKQMTLKPIIVSHYFNYDLTKKPVYNHNIDQFFVRFTLDSPVLILKSFVKSFVPAISEIKAFYNDNRIWMLPFNYIKFLSWRIVEWIK